MADIKTYILAPTRDTPPDGPIALGNLITSPRFPEERQNTSPPPPLEGANRVYESHKDGWRSTQAHSRTVGGGVFGEFLQLAGLGSADVDGTHTRGQKRSLYARALDTYWFNPDAAYLQRCLKDEGVRAYLGEQHRWRHPGGPPLYAVTGLMVARGASETVSAMRERGLHAQVGADLTAVGAPVTVGPKVEVSGSREEEGGFDGASDFVFAYRLKWLKLKSDGRIKSGAYTKSATYADEYIIGEDGELRPAGPEVIDVGGGDVQEGEYEVEDSEDVGAQSLGTTKSPMVFDDEGGSIECVVLPVDDPASSSVTTFYYCTSG